ncbi:MAG: carboxypeptidase-like regulatory domain-containing protein [Terracidiphilus sp.]
MKSKRFFVFLTSLGFIFAGAAAQAATVNGVVTNKTTGKPDAGDPVVLVQPMTGMSEVGHTTTDSQGRYSLNLPSSAPYLIKVTHQGTEYFIPAPEGGGQGDISVYDVAAKVSGVSIGERVAGVESENGQLHVVERYDIHNLSTPPTTQWSKKSFEVVLPTDAVVGDVSAQRPGAGSLPTSVKLDPDGPKGHYSFNFPIQPDEAGKGTLFQIQYELPYSDNKYTFHSLLTIPADSFWVVMPKSMTFASASGTKFELSPQDPTVQTYLMRNAPAGKSIDYTISGAGSFPREDQGAQGGGQADNSQGAGVGNQPGGGIGEPINTPDPLSKYKWWILGGIGLLLATVAAFLLRRPATAVPAGQLGTVSSASAVNYVPPATPAAKNAALLNALKEELFALESEKIAGTLPQAEYAEQKAALETVLKRALKRS